MQGGCDVLALAFEINSKIVRPLEALQPPAVVDPYTFPFGTHTGYQVQVPPPSAVSVVKDLGGLSV